MKTASSLICLLVFMILAIGPVQAELVMPPGYRIETVADGLNHPSAMVLAPDGRIFYLERLTGNVRIIQNGKLLGSNFVNVAVATFAEEGLLGIALHPNFNSNGYIYIYYTQLSPKTNRIVRYKAEGNTGTGATVMLDNIGSATNGTNNGGGLVFGNDGKLYATVGDLEDSPSAQLLTSLKGKVLRINDDGTAPTDNPYYGTQSYPYNLIYSLGFRNSANIAVNKNLGTIYATDNYDTQASCDETNVIKSATNYGWDVEECLGSVYTAPLQTIDPQITAAGITPYTGSKYPAPKVCSNNPNKACFPEKVCSNNNAQPCLNTKHCSNDPYTECVYNKVCQVTGTPCTTDANCQFPSINPCVFFCGTGNTCVETCGTGATCDLACGGASCVDATTNPLFVGGEGNGTIIQDVLSGAAYDAVQASSAFYLPNGADCPVTIKDLDMSSDGWVYVLSDDPDTGQAGIYRIIYDASGGNYAKPREVSASRHMNLTLAKDGSGLRLWWEDLKKDIWTCSDETGDGTCDVPGEKTTKYTIWSGTLNAPFSYTHTALAESNGDGTSQTDALVSYGIPSMPTGNVYYLVSGRSANLEGTTGYKTGSVERPGYDPTASEICNAVTWGNIYHKCANNWPDPVLPAGSVCSPDEPGFPDQYNRCHRIHDWRGKVVLLDFAQFG